LPESHLSQNIPQLFSDPAEEKRKAVLDPLTAKLSIPPTVLFSTVGRMEDVSRAVTMHFKNAGDAVYVVGLTKNELGGSEYFRLLARQQGTPRYHGGHVPSLDIAGALSIYRAMSDAAARDLLRSSHTPTLGGLAIALVLPAIGGDLGVEIDLLSLACDGALDDDARLFSESNSRFVITCAPDDESEMNTLFHGLPLARIGTVLAERRVRIKGENGRRLVDLSLDALRHAFKDTLYGV
jgi:phosphoribosylformylglycinamidine (FGAM) synthase-like enzyme